MQVYVLVFGSECQVRTYVRAFVRRSSAPSTEEKILPVNPFESLDTKGVGRLMTIAVDEGRKAREDLEVGICGEHGGDPASIHFCHQLGLNYVSCSPYRVPVARLAAAQAALETKERDR